MRYRKFLLKIVTVSPRKKVRFDYRNNFWLDNLGKTIANLSGLVIHLISVGIKKDFTRLESLQMVFLIAL